MRRGLGKRPARTATRGGPASASPAPLPHLSQGTGSRTTHKGKRERLTRGTEPCEGGFVTATAGCPQRGAHGVEDPRRLPTPPSGARDRRWRHSLNHTWMHESRRAGPGRRLEQAGGQRAESGSARRHRQARSHASQRRRGPSLSYRMTTATSERVSTYLAAKSTSFRRQK